MSNQQKNLEIKMYFFLTFSGMKGSRKLTVLLQAVCFPYQYQVNNVVSHGSLCLSKQGSAVLRGALDLITIDYNFQGGWSQG